MLLLYMKYSFLLWVAIGSESADLKLMRQLSEDDTPLKVAACSQSCLTEGPDKVKFSISIAFANTYDICAVQLQGFADCFEFCRNGNLSDLMPTELHKVQENFQLSLVCRTESQLSFRINWVQHNRNNSTIEPPVVFIISIYIEGDGGALIYLVSAAKVRRRPSNLYKKKIHFHFPVKGHILHNS